MFIITGGGSGIGQALALNLADRGYEVLIIGRREQLLADTAAKQPAISYLSADVSTGEGRYAIVSHLSDIQKIDGLIHNAGTIDPISPIQKISESAWHQAMATNIDAPLFVTQLLSEKLHGGRVLNISSGAAHFPIAGWAAYCVAKAALSMLARCWQLEIQTIAFASVMPGIIDTPMQDKIREATSMEPEKLVFFRTLKEQEKLLKPETVAIFLSWLLLDITTSEFQSKEWDIYDQSHHQLWLKPPHIIPTLD